VVELEELKGIRDRLATGIRRAEEELRTGKHSTVSEMALVERRKLLAQLEQTIKRLEAKSDQSQPLSV
jgi:hypothetical protein